MRANNRKNDELRPLKITRHYTKYAEGSVLVEFGETKVLCNASIVEGVPKFLKNTGKGWLTAEYGMLPRATHERIDREAARGKQSGRTYEIQRLIGRSLRAALDLNLIGEKTITIDCDVIQADGGTRTASITGGCVALIDALRYAQENKIIIDDPLRHFVASVSVGIKDNQPILDLNYEEDSTAETDMNVVMNDEGGFIEIQGTAEGKAFSPEQFNEMLNLAKKGIGEIVEVQKKILKN